MKSITPKSNQRRTASPSAFFARQQLYREKSIEKKQHLLAKMEA
jgi:hypothetical protein